MLRSGDIVNHKIKIYTEGIGSIRFNEEGLPSLIGKYEVEPIGIEERLAIIEYSFGERYGNGKNDGEFSIRYLDSGHSLSWIDEKDLDYVCTSTDYIIKQLKEK